MEQELNIAYDQKLTREVWPPSGPLCPAFGPPDAAAPVG